LLGRNLCNHQEHQRRQRRIHTAIRLRARAAEAKPFPGGVQRQPNRPRFRRAGDAHARDHPLTAPVSVDLAIDQCKPKIGMATEYGSSFEMRQSPTLWDLVEVQVAGINVEIESYRGLLKIDLPCRLDFSIRRPRLQIRNGDDLIMEDDLAPR